MAINSDVAKATRLAQMLPTDTAEHLLFTAVLITEIMRIHVVNLTGTQALFRLWHVPAGGVVANIHALLYDYPVNTAIFQESLSIGTGIVLEPGDMIYVRSATANAIAFNLYGTTPEMAPRAAY